MPANIAPDTYNSLKKYHLRRLCALDQFPGISLTQETSGWMLTLHIVFFLHKEQIDQVAFKLKFPVIRFAAVITKDFHYISR